MTAQIPHERNVMETKPSDCLQVVGRADNGALIVHVDPDHEASFLDKIARMHKW